jgi:hypothetical protein
MAQQQNQTPTTPTTPTQTSIDDPVITTITPFTISIMIKTSGNADTEFKRSMLKTDAMKNLRDLSEFPFMTYDLRIPDAIEQMFYSEKLNFFFNRFKFLEIMNAAIPPGTKKSHLFSTKLIAKLTKDDTTNEIAALNEIVQHNVTLMLKCLFPSHYPSKYNVLTSYDQKIAKSISFDMKFADFFPSFGFKPAPMFLEIGGKSNTIVTVTWLNDIFNSPEYQELVKQFMDLNVWKKQKSMELDANIGNNTDNQLMQFQTAFTATTMSAVFDKMRQKFTLNDLQLQRPNGASTPNYATIDEDTNLFTSTTPTVFEQISQKREMNRSIKTTYDLLIDISKEISMKHIEVLKNKVTELTQAYDKIKPYFTDQKLQNNINNVIKVINELYEMTIFRKYIDDKPGINMQYLSEGEQIVNAMKAQYANYTNFTESIGKFVYPTKQNTNAYLQIVLDKFRNKPNDAVDTDIYRKEDKNTAGRDYSKLFGQIMDGTNIGNGVYPAECSLLGITIRPPDTPNRLAIHVQMELIGTEVTDANRASIDCPYKDNYLGSMLEKLIYPSAKRAWEIDAPFTWDSKGSGAASNPVQAGLQAIGLGPPQGAAPMGQAAAPVQGMGGPPIQGGRKTRHRLRWAIKTRKRYMS